MKLWININTIFKMKKIVIIIMLICSFQTNAQWGTINDKAIVYQHKRMVFESWGNFYPKPVYKKILWWKIQTSMNASLMWGDKYYGVPLNWVTDGIGLTDTKRNRRYRSGKDIRPLKATGLQNQRYAEREIQITQTKKIKKQAEEIKKKALRDFYHNNAIYSKMEGNVSPVSLWNLYYRKKLKPLKQFSENPINYLQWGFSSQEVFEKLNKTGGIRVLKEKLDLLKHDYKIARTVDMPRGKRMLLYHKCLLDWRKFNKMLNYYNNSIQQVIDIENKMLKKNEKLPIRGVIKPKSDLEKVKYIMNKYKNKF